MVERALFAICFRQVDELQAQDGVEKHAHGTAQHMAPQFQQPSTSTSRLAAVHPSAASLSCVFLSECICNCQICNHCASTHATQCLHGQKSEMLLTRLSDALRFEAISVMLCRSGGIAIFLQ